MALPPLLRERMRNLRYARGQNRIHNLKIRGEREHCDNHHGCGRFHLAAAWPRNPPHLELQLADIILYGLRPGFDFFQ